MGKLFSLDSPIVQILNKISQLMIFTVIWLLCCLPVFTAGAATAALYRMMFNMKEDKSCAVKEYFRAFRSNFRKATVLWLILLFCAAVTAILFYLMLLVEQTVLRMIALAVFCVLFFAVYIAGLYLFPLTAYFENTVLGTLSNAISMGIANLRQTIIAGAVTMIPLVIAIAWPNLFIQMLFLWMVMGPGTIAYGVTCALTPVFRRYALEEAVEE